MISINTHEFEYSGTQGFISKEIFKKMLWVGIFCCGMGFTLDISITLVSSAVIDMSALLFLYLTILLLLIDRIPLHINMRWAFIAVLFGTLIEFIFDEGGMTWINILPPVAFALFGKKEGGTWSLIGFALILSWMILNTILPILSLQFSIIEISNIIFTYIVMTLISYFYTSHIDDTHALILQHAREQERLTTAQVISGGIAHLINNEMQVIIGNASILKREVHDYSQLKNIQNITEYAFKASNHANELLAYAENSPKFMRENDLKSILLSLSDRWLAQLPENIQLQIKLPKYLSVCYCDSNAIQHALNILFENALEACQPTGLIQLQASIEQLLDDEPKLHLKKGNYIKISMKDDGAGIKKSYLDKIFEPFFSTKFEGRGLGLSAAHGIIKQHGGNLHAQSTEGKGTTLTIFLPIVTTIQKN